MRLVKVNTLFLLLQGALAMSAADWRSRSVYQVFTDRFARTDGSTTSPCNVADKQFCGGTWKGIENKLDYIKNMGFTAIWISPITEQIKEGYHGYYQKNLYNVNQNFGSEDDLKSLTAALHARDMWLMVDVVPNHMGASGCPETVDYGGFGNLNDAKYYHSYCPINNFDNQTEVEDCWVGGCTQSLPDLKTEQPEVAKELNTWIKEIVSKYNIDGLRVDSAKHVNIDFLPPWCRAAGVFCMGEVAEGKANYTYPYQQYIDGILNYPLYHSIERTFQQQTNMSDLVVGLAACTNNKEVGCKDPTLMGTFFENHDNPRFAHGSKDLSQVKNALAFTIMNDGIPIIYQGQEQHYDGDDDPYCREALWLSGYNTNHPLYKHIALLNQIRNHITSSSPNYIPYTTWVLSYTADVIQLRKDEIRTILTNKPSSSGSSTFTTEKMGFVSGATIVDVLSCEKYKADSKGEVSVTMKDGSPVILLPESSLKGSGLCGYT